MKKQTKFLDNINFPSDLKKVPESKLQIVADELRNDVEPPDHEMNDCGTAALHRGSHATPLQSAAGMTG